MKYYGLKKTIYKENVYYHYARIKTRIKSIMPGKNKELWKNVYDILSRQDMGFTKFQNGIPENKYLKLQQIVTADLILREDMTKLQKGIIRLLKKHRSGDRFWALPIDSIEAICEKITKMDSTLLSWYNRIKCGVFDFRGEPLEDVIDYYTVNISNINSSFLSLEFCIYLTKETQEELNKIINSDYHDSRGYIQKVVSSPKSGGAIDTYTLCHFSDEALKADKIYEFISCIEWDFYEALKKYFPFILHKQSIVPPRIEVFYTDIDYREDNRWFWGSIGIHEYNGQFIDDRHKMFFDYSLSGRYERIAVNNRLLYVVKDDNIPVGQFKSIKDEVYYHIDGYSQEYLKLMFLEVLSRYSGKIIVNNKQKLDKIKLKRNRINFLLKLRYEFEKDIDIYNRYVKDDSFSKSIEKLNEIYKENDEIVKKISKPFFKSCSSFCKGILANSEKINESITALQNEFDGKRLILQHLSDYKNTSKSIRLNYLMLLITAATLFFVLFPSRIEWTANLIRSLYHWMVENLFGWILIS